MDVNIHFPRLFIMCSGKKVIFFKLDTFLRSVHIPLTILLLTFTHFSYVNTNDISNHLTHIAVFPLNMIMISIVSKMITNIVSIHITKIGKS